MSNYSSNEYAQDPNTPWYKIINLVPEGSKVLDIGCSSGNLGAALKQQKKCTVIGLDLDQEDVSKAAKRLDAAYVRNAETDDLSDLGKFDCVIFADVIEHLVDPVKTLEKIKNVLTKSGSVIFSIPNMAHMGTRLMLLDGRFVYGETGLLDKTHLHYYDRQEVERVIHDAGYVLESFDWVERYLPEKVVTNQLKNMGLEPTEAFLRKSQEVESTAYEFIGKATVQTESHSVSTKLPFASPYVGVTEEQVANSLAIREQEFEKERIEYGQEIEELRSREARIISSISWRITLPLRIVNGYAWRIRQKIRVLIHGTKRNPRYNLYRRSDLKEAERIYRSTSETLENLKRDSNTKAAVVLHLYYTDSWVVIAEKLAYLKGKIPFDLYVTLPTQNKEFAKEIKEMYPAACIVEVPNRGRDVLPFLEIAQFLEDKGYEYLLKLHSKKSPHRSDGQQWFDDITGNLLPSSPVSFRALEKALNNKQTGLIGPAGQYISLRVNYDANSYFLFKILQRVFSKKVAKEVSDNKAEYGFFAGTMFWARLDSLNEILNQHYGASDFEHEGRHIDGTLAHGLERAFCVVAEVNQKDLYEIGRDGLKKVNYKTGNIPDWSDVYIGPKAAKK
jgi:2-polyprenyl-3-methyl-5-hydroxy-6-metoxy-1,4-benzoquinol methylase